MLKKNGSKLIRRFDRELLQIEPWGENGLRVRASVQGEIADYDFGLLPGQEREGSITIDGNRASVTNGQITCEVLPTGKLRFCRKDGTLLLEEYDRNRFRKEEEGFNSALELSPRMFFPIRGTNHFQLQVRFEAQDEKIFGMGQYQQENLDLKGCIVELAQRNSQISIPFALSSRGYGILWNNPAIGKVTFGSNLTEWEAKSTKQMDYWITAGDTPAEIVEQYAQAVGKAPMMPAYGTGFWQCKLRYQTQEELMEVAREYYRRKLPVSVIVIDYFHWPHQGDWCFDSQYWPDPAGMVRELKEMGMELMVSVWPTVEEGSVHYQEMLEEGLLTASEAGNRMSHLGRTCFVDMTNPRAQEYVWQKLKEHYYKYGIRIFWLDEAEPEYTKYEYDNYRYYKGTDLEIGNLYPRDYAKMAYEGMRREGQENILNLIRSAWVGSQRYGALVWSGDIDSSFRSLRNQFAAGLNTGIAGLPWWTTDIGGFHGGNIYEEDFKECLIRWFEYGTFCPVFRLHGDREPHKKPIGTSGGGLTPSGAENEVWSYGEEAYQIFTKYMRLREQMRPYITETMRQAHEKGTPVIRPVFYNTPSDERSWEVTDQFFLGDDILVCPILYEKVTKRTVYLPAGSSWRELFTGLVYEGGQTIACDAPIDIIPVFIKEAASSKAKAVWESQQDSR